jgi:hypothetical protein
VAWRVYEIYQELLGLGLRIGRGAAQQREEERDGRRLHGNAAQLLIRARVEVTDLAGELGGDDAIGGDEGVCEGGFAMVLAGQSRCSARWQTHSPHGP